MSTTARIRFADGHLDDVASLLAGAHPYAAQYLEQAPALAILACTKFGHHITYGELDRFRDLAAGSPRLRDMLSAYGANPSIRKLEPTALRHRDGPILAELMRLDPSTLAQSVPSASQRVWLDGISKWMRLTPNSKAKRKAFNVAWIARHLGEDLSRFEQVEALVDFLGRGDGALNERWTWKRAMEEVQDWHRRLNDEAALRRALADERRAADFDKVICKAPLPDTATVGGYDFVTLRTARRLREEGVTMHHCVASYASEVKRGLCAVVSVRREGVNVATLQINKKGEPTQIKAHCNQAVSTSIRTACADFTLSHWKLPEIAQ